MSSITQAAFLALDDANAQTRYYTFYQWAQRNIDKQINPLDYDGAQLDSLAVNGSYVQKVSAVAGSAAFEPNIVT